MKTQDVETRAKAAGRAKAKADIVAWLQMWAADLFMDEDAESYIMYRTLKEAAGKIKRGEHLKDLKARKRAKRGH